MVPKTIGERRKVDDDLRADLWTCIQTRFKVNEVYKDYLFMILGQRWKGSESRLFAAIRKVFTCPDFTFKVADLKPDNIKSAEEWNNFAKKKLSERFKKTGQKFKAMRVKNKLPHTMSRKGYARLEEMKKESATSEISRDELWCKAQIRKDGQPLNSVVVDCIAKINEHNAMSQSSQRTASVTQDGVSKIFGKEYDGCVRGLGFGIVPSRSHHESNNLIVQKQPKRNAKQTENQPRKCKLLSWKKQIVAEGTVASTVPNCLVHFQKLGPNGWKVWVDAAVDSEAFLLRPNTEMSTIAEANNCGLT